MTEYKIGEITDFPEGQAKKANVNGIEVAVINVEGDLYAIQNRCVHKNLPLHIVGEDRYYSGHLIEEGFYDVSPNSKSEDQDIRGGINPEELTINCPWHYLEWDLQTGCNEEMDRCIATYDVRVGEGGSVHVEI